MVGKGGYGEVYRGVLDDGRAVAVKRLAPTAAADEKKEKDFLTELGTVGHVRHPNVSALLGCCVDRGLHLVFHFSTRGSVSANLHGKCILSMSLSFHPFTTYLPSDPCMSTVHALSLCGTVPPLTDGVVDEQPCADLKLPAMSWKQRHGIAVGTARGLRYLHKGCARRIIHRDIKASNVLLGHDFEPQVKLLSFWPNGYPALI